MGSGVLRADANLFTGSADFVVDGFNRTLLKVPENNYFSFNLRRW
jgi:hypothetical protein